jgi:nitrogen fixation/metabolism regulation signal transduction histidine kinase
MVMAFILTVYVWRGLQDITRENRAPHSAKAELRTSVQQLMQTESFLNSLVENVPATIFVRQLPEGRFVLINREGESLLGMPR